MMVRPFVSVLMTSYNREKYIGEAIESVLASTYTDFELLIVDDCSADKTVEIARDYEKKDSRVKVYLNEKNLGDYHNRNRAASLASGKYIKYVDSDDLIYPNSLEIFISGMEKFPDAAVGIMSGVGQEEKPYPYALQPDESYKYHFYTRGLFDTGPSALIFHAERFREIGGFSGKRYVGDTEINLRLAAKWPVVKLAGSLVFWRQHEGQEIVKGFGTTGYLELQLPLFREELSKPVCPLQESQRKGIIAYYSKLAAREVMKIALVKRQPALAITLYKRLSLTAGDMINGILFIKRKY